MKITEKDEIRYRKWFDDYVKTEKYFSFSGEELNNIFSSTIEEYKKYENPEAYDAHIYTYLRTKLYNLNQIKITDEEYRKYKASKKNNNPKGFLYKDI